MNIQIRRQGIAYDADKYSSFPDIILSPQGELLCIYREGERHHPDVSTIVLLWSKDGTEWSRSEFAHASLEEDGYVFNCPRINIIGSKIIIVSDIKTSTDERTCEWNIFYWESDDADTWTEGRLLGIKGMVPDKIVPVFNQLLMGYHIIGERNLKQALAISKDGGLTWNNQKIIADNIFHDFCEGSICKLTNKHLICYLRDNKKSNRPAYYINSFDSGESWSIHARLNIKAHRIVSAIKRRKPYRGSVIGTCRDTGSRSVKFFIHDTHNNKLTSFDIEKETFDSLYDFGYTGFVEKDDGSLCVVYYIKHQLPNPKIKMATIEFE